MSFHSILEPLSIYGKLDGIDMGNLACVDRTCAEHVNWEQIRNTYKPISPESATSYTQWQRHVPRMGFTKALKKFRLIPADVAHIPPYKVTYGDCINICWVVGVALLKYGGPNGLHCAMRPSSKAYKARQAKLSELDITQGERAALKDRGLSAFEKNGSGGVWNIKLLLQQHRQLIEQCKRLPETHRDIAVSLANSKQGFARSFELIKDRVQRILEGPEWLSRALEAQQYSAIPDSLREAAANGEFRNYKHCYQAVETKIGPEKRSKELQAALHAVGLQLRSDSKVCHNYVAYGGSTLEDVITVMLEMDWLFKHTSYGVAMKTSMQKEYDRNRRNWQYAYSISDSDDESPVISRAVISEECKEECVKQWLTNNGPDQLPQSLKRFIKEDS